jgi:hypothetical protein
VGTWIIRAQGPRDATGDFVGHGSDDAVYTLAYPPPGFGTVRADFPPADALIHLDGSPTPTAEVALPNGFVPDDDLVLHTASGVAIGSTNPSDSIRVQQSDLGVDELYTVYEGAGFAPRPFTVPGITGGQLVGVGGSTVLFSGTSPSGGVNGQVSVYTPCAFISGTYVAFSWWWRVVGVDDCGNTFEGPFFQTGVDPGPPWVRLDPDDEGAHPTPVVLNVTPNHGLLAGGTPFELHGSGFGVGCTVTFDGVPATDVVAVTETRITGVSPAHAAGLVDVVVTNTDGVSS